MSQSFKTTQSIQTCHQARPSFLSGVKLNSTASVIDPEKIEYLNELFLFLKINYNSFKRLISEQIKCNFGGELNCHNYFSKETVHVNSCGAISRIS